MNTEILTQYNDLRTNILYDFTHSPLFKMEAEELSLFLYYWQQTHCVFTSYINRKTTPKELNPFLDPKDFILKETWDLYNNTLTNITTNAKWTDYLIKGINPLSAREFYYIEKGKYYLGYDLDEDLIGVMPYLKDQALLEKYNEELKAYFKFRYDTYDLSLLGEFTAVPFGIHENRLNKYKKTGILTFDYPKEIFKYPVKEWFDKMMGFQDNTGTKLINIRGTNGSGKTTMVNTLFLRSTNKETKTFELTNRNNLVRKRYFDVLYDRHIILLGGYDTPYGTKGADRLGDVTEIIEGIIYVINNYPGWTIVMESATVSTSFWSYAILFDLLKKQGVEIILVHLFMRDWDFVTNNVKNRTERKEGAKEPEYDSIKNKRFILYKNHFRFNSILGKTFIAYPDDYPLEEKYKLMENILCMK